MQQPETIKNKATGDSIEFIQTDKGTNGRISEFIMTLSPNSSWAKSPKHFHPFQTETFKVISGELNLNVGKQHLVLTPNHNKVTVNKFVLHGFWNNTNQEVKFITEIIPPRNIERGIRMTYKLADKGKINKRNIPFNPFYSLLLMKQFDSYFPYIPWKLQRLVFNFGAKIASMLGFK